MKPPPYLFGPTDVIGGVFWPQDRDDLLRLAATLQAIEARQASKAPVCRELLAKLGPYLDAAAGPAVRQYPGGPLVAPAVHEGLGAGPRSPSGRPAVRQYPGAQSR